MILVIVLAMCGETFGVCLVCYSNRWCIGPGTNISLWNKSWLHNCSCLIQPNNIVMAAIQLSGSSKYCW